MEMKYFEDFQTQKYKLWCIKTSIWDILRDLVPFLLFKKCEKHPWRSDT